MILDDKLKNIYNENSFKDRIDMFVRKLSSNSTYTIVKAILGFDLGMIYDATSEYHRKSKKAGYDFYRFRNYGEGYNDLNIHENFDVNYVGKYDITHNKIKLNVERQTRVEAGKYRKIKPHNISMINNFIANSEIPYNEYLYKCSLDLSTINDKGMIRLHEYLFPVYIDKFQGSNYSDWELAKIIRTFGIEVSFGRDKIDTLSDFKMKYVFANELSNDNKIGDRITAHENIRGFEFVRWDDVTTHKRNKNVLLEAGEHTEYSRVRNSRGNHIYKYRMTSIGDTTHAHTWDTNYFGRQLRGHFMHADMVYGMQRAMIHPQYSTPDENYNKWLVDMVGGYSMNSLIPNYPTVYVDFCAQNIASGQKGIDEIFSDNMHLIGFIRIRLYSSNSESKADLNIGVIQKKYGSGGKENKSTGCTRELTNSESFTVKIIIPKRTPLMLYERNSTNGEQIYMLPPNIFNCQYIYKNSVFPILENVNNDFVYKTLDTQGFYSANFGDGVRWDGSKSNLICAQGGWLFPPLRFASFSGDTDWNSIYGITTFDYSESLNHYYNCIPKSSDIFMKNLRGIAGLPVQ